VKKHQNVYPVKVLCKAMQVSRSGYYQVLEAKPMAPEKQQLEEQVVEVFQQHRRRYGVRRVCRELKQRGLKVGKDKCRKVMKKHGLKAIQPRSFVPRTTQSRHPYPISPNLLLEREAPKKPCEVWVGDITYIPLSAGKWAYLSVWMDLYSRKITGWHLDHHMREELVISSFEKALGRNTIPDGLIIHSDRGGQYAGGDFRKVLQKRKINQSMSRADNPYDNAFMESYFSRFKAELLEDGIFGTLEDAQTEIFEYIEMYYNTQRRHSALDYRSPLDYEKHYFYSLTKQVICP
jgi:putative transposase